MKTKQEIEQLAFLKYPRVINDNPLCRNPNNPMEDDNTYERKIWIGAYTQCQQDMAKELEMHILVNEHDWSRNPQAQLKDFIKQLNNIGTKDDDLNFLGQITI